MFSAKKERENGNFFLIAGPCVVEEEDTLMRTAERLRELTQRAGIPFVFKASYRKANRTRKDSFEGIGDEEALRLLEKVKKELELPLLTDVHLPEEADLVAGIVDVLQIPAFLCRQTELLEAAGRTGRTVNVKKGQFSGPRTMHHAVEKVGAEDGQEVWLTERGNFFGYQDLVVDMRNIPRMQECGAPVVLDVTHSLQQPEQGSGVTGGDPSMIHPLAKAGLAAGADGIFLETHPEPEKALSDGANMLKLDRVEELLKELKGVL